MAQTFAVGSPRAYQPSATETALLQMMPTSPAGARIGSMYLGNYWQERQQSENAYDQQVALQNQFAYQQLAQKMADDRMKNAVTMFGHPGGAEVIGATPSLSGALGPDISLPALGDVAQIARQGQLANAIKGVGQGAYGLAEAGTPASASGLASIIPQADISQGVPLALQVQASKNSAAAARAAAAQNDPGYTYSVDLGKDDQGASLGHVSEKVSNTRGGIPGAVARGRQAQVVAQGVTGGTPYGSPGSTSGVAAGQPRGSDAPPAVQGNANTFVHNLQFGNPQQQAAYKDITAAMPGGGGNAQLVKKPDGSYKIRGASGAEY